MICSASITTVSGLTVGGPRFIQSVMRSVQYRRHGDGAQQVGICDQCDRPVGVVENNQRALIGVFHQVRGGGKVPVGFDRGRGRGA